MMHAEPNPPPSDDGGAPLDPINHDDTGVAESDQIAAELQAVVDDVGQFLTAWSQKLDQCVASSLDAGASTDAILQKRIEDFRKEQRQQESIRQAEQRELQTSADLLAQAWLKLESEQREFLQLKALATQPQANRDLRSNGESSRPARAAAPAPAAAQESSLPPPSPNFPAVAPLSQNNLSTTTSRDSAVRQFQRLRREIAASRPNNSSSVSAKANRPLTDDHS
jgi:hypothetical protein